MLRILHLVDHSPDYQTQTSQAQLARASSSFSTDTRSIGWGGTYGNAVTAVLHLRRHREKFDLTHAWGETALNVAAIGVGGRIVYSPSRFPTQKAVRWLRSVMEYRDVHVVCPTDTMRRALVERGVAIERCHLIRPGVDFATVKRRRDPQLRSSLGFEDGDFVLLAVGESTRAADHPRSLWTAAILHVLDPKYRLLLWGRGPVHQTVKAFARKLGLPKLYRIAPSSMTFEALLPATDLALLTPSGPVATLPIAVTMAAGLPIVSMVNATVAELLEDRHNALLVPTEAPRQIARRVLDLLDNDNLQWSICDMARTEAFEYFTQTRFVEQMTELYSQFAGSATVRVTVPPPGAGTRFHGQTGVR